MATRAEIRDAFTSELKAASGTYDVTDENGNVLGTVTLDSDNIGLRDPAEEELPGIVYHDDYRRVIYNGAGAGPDMVVRDANGNVLEEQWHEHMEAQFIIDVRANNDVAKEPIYEALRSNFGKYQFAQWDEKSLHSDIKGIEVVDSTSVDSGDTDHVIRGDQLEVRIEYKRDYVHDTDNIQAINTAVDADDDGTVDDTYTTQ